MRRSETELMLRISDDVRTGLIFIALSAFFATTAYNTLQIGTPGTMGPGFFPLLVSALLAVVGVAIIVTRAHGEGEAKRPVSWRGLFWVTAAPIVFALLVRTLGLAPALLAGITCSVLASRKIGWQKGIVIVLGLTLFCIAVFSYGIGLSARLLIWPPEAF